MWKWFIKRIKFIFNLFDWREPKLLLDNRQSVYRDSQYDVKSDDKSDYDYGYKEADCLINYPIIHSWTAECMFCKMNPAGSSYVIYNQTCFPQMRHESDNHNCFIKGSHVHRKCEKCKAKWLASMPGEK